MSKLSIVIVNYNVKYFLEQALSSVFRSQTNFAFEVFVVDNASVDGSAAMVAEKFPQVKLIESKENLGFSRGNNLAIRQSDSPYVLLLNPDTIIREDTLQQVVDFMEKTPDAGALGVKMIDGKGQFLPESKRGFPSPRVAFYKMSGLARLFPRSKKFGQYHLGYLDPDQTNAVDVLSGAFMLLRKSVLDKIGLLDEDYFMYGEDIDLSYRITLAGYKNYYYPHAPIIHFKGESTKKGSLNYVKVFYQAMIIFAQKHIKGGAGGRYISLLQMAIYFRAFLALLSRAWSKAGWLIADGIMLLGVLYTAQWLWVHVVRVNEGLHFEPTLWYINFPIYISTWLLSAYLAGAYDKHSRLFNLLGGLTAGTLVIGAIYGFLPNELRSSRGIIVYGWLVSSITLAAARYMLAAFKGRTRGLFFEERKTVIVGTAEQAQRVSSLLKEIAAKREYLGFISPNAKDAVHDLCLGHLHHLKEIMPFLQADEIIFCSGDIPAYTIISELSQLGREVDFKIASEESPAIIGSHSRNDTGELLTYDIGFKITKNYLKRLKRVTDILTSMAMIAIIPLTLLLQHNRIGFIKNLIKVLSGRKTWVSYCKKDDAVPEFLPPVIDGVLCPLDNIAGDAKKLSPKISARLNYQYARDYSPLTDLQIMFNGFRNLGDQ